MAARRGRGRGESTRGNLLPFRLPLSGCNEHSVRDKPDPPHSSPRSSSPSPAASSTPPSSAMASVLLRRQLTQTSPRAFVHTTKSCRSATVGRGLRTSAVLQQAEPVHASASAERKGNPPPETGLPRNLLDVHTVEDLQGMSAADLLAESGTRKDAQMRHFTGTSAEVCCIKTDH